MQKIQHEVMKSDVEAVKTRRESTLQPQALPAVIAEADISRPALVSPGFEKEKPLTRLADLRPPANLRDPAAFFDCACEVSTHSEFSASARPNSIYRIYRSLKTCIQMKCVP